MFNICQQLIAYQAWLIDPLLTAEQEYKKVIIDFEDDGLSHASAETKAQITAEYRLYKKIDRTYKLIDEQQKLVKKFAQLLNDEQMNIP